MKNDPLEGYGPLLDRSDLLGDPSANPPKVALIPIAVPTLYGLMLKGQFPRPVKVGTRSFWRRDDIRRVLEKGTQ